jgi:predicted nucleic acid-binding Zn ribbon protein
MLRSCVICGACFSRGRNPRQKTCSPWCSRILLRENNRRCSLARTRASPKRIIVPCAVCGQDFKRKNSLEKTCSNDCYEKDRWQRYKDRPLSNNRRMVCVNHRQKMRALALAAMGGKCMRCGFDDERCLHFDHRIPLHRGKNGMDRKAHTSDRTYRAVLNGDHSTYELLCANCHAIKTREDQINGVEAVLPVVSQLSLL